MFGLFRKRSVIDQKAQAAECMEMWRDAVAELALIQNDCQSWLDSVPASLADSTTAEALRAVCALDLSELKITEPPRRTIADGKPRSKRLRPASLCPDNAGEPAPR